MYTMLLSLMLIEATGETRVRTEKVIFNQRKKAHWDHTIFL